MSFHARLAALERTHGGESGCPACRGRETAAVELPGQPSPPMGRCEHCGRMTDVGRYRIAIDAGEEATP